MLLVFYWPCCSAHRNNDADIFRPERWIEADPSTRARYERTTEAIFGSGRFVCLGKNIAVMELNKAFVEVRAPNFPEDPH